MSVGGVDWAFLGQRVGLGVLLGLAVGYATKKALKIVLIIVALVLLLLLGLQSLDVITINWHIVEQAYSQAFQQPTGIIGRLTDWAGELAILIPVAGSFTLGFVIGFRLG
ncbi:MAG: hypothetical protein GX161_14270 [Firmicutes bacterium]|jgi:uncharacterized membrane protein (Fun14 family)|nr:hypothetical protein [Bacillota bacterium]